MSTSVLYATWRSLLRSLATAETASRFSAAATKQWEKSRHRLRVGLTHPQVGEGGNILCLLSKQFLENYAALLRISGMLIPAPNQVPLQS